MWAEFSVICSYLVAYLGTCGGTLSDEEFDGSATLTLEHSFDSGPEPIFTPRGSIITQSLKSNIAFFTQERPFSDEEKEKLKHLVEIDGVYRVRIAEKSSDHSRSHVMAFGKACGLYESKLSDHLTIHVDQFGAVLGLAATTHVPYCLGVTVSDSQLETFNTTVDIVQTVLGPSPETQSYVEKIDRDKAEKAKGQDQDNRSFIAKYWMYIVPVVLIMMFANSAGEQGGAGGGR